MEEYVLRRMKGMITKSCVAALLLSAVCPVLPGTFAASREAGLVTLAGMPGSGMINDMGKDSRFAFPLGIDVRNHSVMIADTDNNLIRSFYGNRVTHQAGRIAGRDAYGAALGGYQDSRHASALLNRPSDCAYMPDGSIAVADRDNHAIRVAGRSWVYTMSGTGEEGYEEGGLGTAKFARPSGIAVDENGIIYVADTGNHCIRRISVHGVTSLVAGVPEQGGFRDGSAGEALFMEPSAVAVSEDGSLYVADMGNQRIRRIADGQVTTLAGGSLMPYLDTEYKMPGLRDGTGSEAQFWFPEGICMAGPVVIVADTGNHVIRAVAPGGTVQTIAGTGETGWEDGPALESTLNRPADVAWEDGILYIMDSGNSALRSMRFDPWKWIGSLEE